MTERIKRLGNGILDLIYPLKAQCVGCGSQAGFERDWLCEDCRQALAERWVGATQPPEGGLIEGAACAYLYGGPAGGMVRSLKYRGVYKLAEPMGRDMARAFEALRPAFIDCVVPVPMHPRRVRQRGYNHAELLARQAAGEMALPCLDALARTKNTRQQARLSHADRMSNLEGAFVLKEDVTGKRVLLVDDVCTTGTTANACARVLLSGGADAVCLLCFAAAKR